MKRRILSAFVAFCFTVCTVIGIRLIFALCEPLMAFPTVLCGGMALIGIANVLEGTRFGDMMANMFAGEEDEP